ncbi:GMC family oxidoreductase [Polynucleobacter brandtiae]|uniref:Choline dehydrogenase n=1 Tax=Polynucleobacter brandtiae TaxID=1938816 RepID=A0A2M8VZ28_9BURK|nr:GMC family oxidoreductase N-terminal domain-containing protein [Polynucleobacter brandtiae]PJI83111.1 choline dehydrogenase [Polynucleobacter brandtiae]
MKNQSFNYIIVGGGSSGCVLANRLSEDPKNSVCLIEAGPKDRSPWIHLPIGYAKTMWDPKLNWKFQTEPDPGMNNRQIYWPRGKTLGGSSSINGLIFIRGQKEDYDGWRDLGNPGWGWDDVLPYFKKAEGNDRLGEPLHSQAGPLKASSIPKKHPLVEAFKKTANLMGIPSTDDFNNLTQEGVGYYQLTTSKGFRCSTAVAYLKPAKTRPNLTILTNSQACRVLFENKKAIGIEIVCKGIKQIIHASHEVILSAGAIQSPQILQLSGIGPSKLLNQFNIPVIQDLPGVGENLQDHLQYRLIYELNQRISTNDQLSSWFGQLKMGLDWLLFRGGPLSIGINQGGLFTRVMADSKTPDIQFHLATLSAEMAGGKVHPFSGFTMSVCQLRPESRGHIRIQSADPLVPPKMLANYLETQYDRDTSIAAIKFARKLAQSEPLRSLITREVKPANVESDAEILEFCRNSGATIFHPTGTCQMGPDSNPMAVLDAHLRVRGVEGLRVVDCSAMPTLPSGNTNWPAVMLAERASDLILGKVGAN